MALRMDEAMCNVISNRVIIGNYLIKSIERNKYNFTVDEFDHFDDELTQRLRQLDYYSSFDNEGIRDFVEDYPYLISYLSDSSLSITKDMNQELLHLILESYFSIGITKHITNAINEAFNICWEANA